MEGEGEGVMGKNAQRRQPKQLRRKNVEQALKHFLLTPGQDKR